MAALSSRWLCPPSWCPRWALGCLVWWAGRCVRWCGHSADGRAVQGGCADLLKRAGRPGRLPAAPLLLPLMPCAPPTLPQTFDHGVICASEQSIVVVDEVRPCCHRCCCCDCALHAVAQAAAWAAVLLCSCVALAAPKPAHQPTLLEPASNPSLRCTMRSRLSSCCAVLTS